MSKESKTVLIGYFNKDLLNPEITFNTPESENDTRELVVITLKPVPKSIKLDNKFDMRKQERSVKKIRKEIRNLKIATERLKK